MCMSGVEIKKQKNEKSVTCVVFAEEKPRPRRIRYLLAALLL